MVEAHHTIKAVVRRTGLTAHAIRVWEKRYGAVRPGRTATNRRLYSEEEVERLGLLHELTRSGYSIGPVAKLSTPELRKLALEARQVNRPPSEDRAETDSVADLLKQCLEAVRRLEAKALEEALKRGATELGALGLLQRVIAPLAQTIGNLWRDGVITAAHEHFASAVIRVFLGHAAAPFAGTDGAPVLVVGTPSGQLHELGALLVGAAAANLGWHVTYLGAGLPAAEIAGAARQNRARAVALSLVYPEDDPRLEGELVRLRELLPPEIPLLVGGRAVSAYRNTLDKIGARQLNDLSGLCSALEELRKPRMETK